MIISNLEKYFPVNGKRGSVARMSISMLWPVDRTEDNRPILTWEQLESSGKILNFLDWLMNVFAFSNTRGISIKLLTEMMMKGECIFDANKWVNHNQFVSILYSMVNEEYLSEFEYEKKIEERLASKG